MRGGLNRYLLKRAIIYVQALGDLTNPTVLWLSQISTITVSLQFHFFVFFFILINDHSTFLTIAQGSYFDQIRERIDTGTRRLLKTSGIYSAAEKNRTQSLIVKSTICRYWLPLAALNSLKCCYY